MASLQNKSEDVLDAEFYKILSLLKAAVGRLSNQSYVELIKIWLEKLCKTTGDRELRNRYLLELGVQVQYENIGSPFTSPPPDGPLPPLYNFSRPQEYQQFFTRGVKYTTVNTRTQLQRLPSKSSSYQYMNEFDDSWYDVSDISSHSDIHSGSGDKKVSSTETSNDNNVQTNVNFTKQYEEKIASLNTIINNLKQENIYLKTRMETWQEELKLYNFQAEKQIHDLSSEVCTLKTKLQDMSDSKVSREAAVNAQCEANVNIMKTTLSETQKQNLELRSVIQVLESTLNEVITLKNNNIATIENEITKTMEAKFLNQLKHTEQKYVIQMQNMKFTYDKKMEELKAMYEEQLTSGYPLHSHHTIRSLHSCQPENSIIKVSECEKKIDCLQESLVNLEDLYKKLESDYSKQMAKLKCQMDIKDKTNEIINMKQQTEQDEAIVTIPRIKEYYEDLLEKHKEQTAAEQRMNQQLINKLKQEILNLLKIDRLKHETEIRSKYNEIEVMEKYPGSVKQFSIPAAQIDLTFVKLQEVYQNLLLQQQDLPLDNFAVDDRSIENMQEDIINLQLQKINIV